MAGYAVPPVVDPTSYGGREYMTITITTRRWATVVGVAGAAAHELKASPSNSSVQLPLITRTGFEQRHIVTSQIGSL